VAIPGAGFARFITHRGLFHQRSLSHNFDSIPRRIRGRLTGGRFNRIAVAVRDRLTFRTFGAFAMAALLWLSSPPAGHSQPDESSEAWCKAHNSDPSAVSHCIEAERGFAPPARRPTEDHVRQAPLSHNLPLPRPRPQAAPQPMPEYVQATDKPQQSAPPPSPMSSDQARPSDARLEE
jgi:hypothetical protein